MHRALIPAFPLSPFDHQETRSSHGIDSRHVPRRHRKDEVCIVDILLSTHPSISKCLLTCFVFPFFAVSLRPGPAPHDAVTITAPPASRARPRLPPSPPPSPLPNRPLPRRHPRVARSAATATTSPRQSLMSGYAARLSCRRPVDSTVCFRSVFGICLELFVALACDVSVCRLHFCRSGMRLEQVSCIIS